VQFGGDRGGPVALIRGQLEVESYISVRIVDSHRAHILKKLQLDTRSELVLFALAHGLVGPS
jgi:FixJ family two-component response regulator